MSDSGIDRDEFRRVLELCSIILGEHFSVGAIKNGRLQGATFWDPDRAVEWLNLHAKRGANLYITGNPVGPETGTRPKASDVTERRILLVDCDPEKTPDDPDGLCETKRATAARVIAEICGATGAAHIDSGRGHQAWVRVEPDVDCEALLNGLRAKFERDGVCIDGTFDASRLMRLPGSVNHRTGRTAQIVDKGTGVPLSAATIASWNLPVPEKVKRDLGPADFDPPTAEDMALVTGVLREIWDNPVGKGERSKRDFLFVLNSLKVGISEEAACRLLYALPGGKANEDQRGERYWIATLESVYKKLDDFLDRKALLESLPDTCKNNPDAVFDSATMESLARLSEEDPMAFARINGKLKRTKGLSKTDYNKALKAAQRKERRKRVNPQEKIRYTERDGQFVDWSFKPNGHWIRAPRGDVATWIRGQGLEADREMTQAIDNAYELVNIPFADEYPEERKWNRGGAQLAFKPSPGPHPTWDQMLRVVGRGLDDAVLEDEWCRKNGIETGAAYLMAWIASMFQQPEKPTAYLFFFGPERVGKSTFWEALNMLMTKGVVSAKHALTTSFNGELAGAVLAVIDDFRLPARRGKVHDNIKDWVTVPQILIHAKGQTAYMEDSYLHWVHCANDPSHCPVIVGDTRITMVEVQKADERDQVDKDEFFAQLKDEAEAFLWTALYAELPASGGRLAVPAVNSDVKSITQESNLDELELWLKEHPEWVTMTDAELVDSFYDTLTAGRAHYWPPGKIRQQLPPDGKITRKLALELREKAPWEGTARDLGGGRSLGRRLSVLEALELGKVSVSRLQRGADGFVWAVE